MGAKEQEGLLYAQVNVESKRGHAIENAKRKSRFLERAWDGGKG